MYFRPKTSGRNRIAPTGSVIMMFSMMRRTVTLQAEPDRYMHHDEEERAQADGAR